jgi:DNA-binding NtrC family response regulator
MLRHPFPGLCLPAPSRPRRYSCISSRNDLSLPLRGRSVFDGKKVLLIDPHQRARDVRASVLRSRGIEVDAIDSLQAARSLWQPKLYDLIMLDALGYTPGEAFDFYRKVKHANPRVRVVFLVGPPTFLSLTWPTEVMAREKEPQQIDLEALATARMM